METKIVDMDQVHEAAEALIEGKLVVFPTETVYGLGANALDPEAVKKVFLAKGRPEDNPLIIHVADPSQVEELVASISDQARQLMEAFWPGPLTLVLPKGPLVPFDVTAGLPTVAIRVPDHPVAQALLRKAKLPVAAPSANLSGKPSPTEARHVVDDLKGRVDYILVGDQPVVGLESTVVDMTLSPPAILRPGGVSREALERVIGPVMEAKKEDYNAPKAPGMKYRHYAPKASLHLCQDIAALREEAQKSASEGKQVGIITFDDMIRSFPQGKVVSFGPRGDLESAAHHLFRILRFMDELEVDVIYSEVVEEVGIGKAIMNRLRKAAEQEDNLKEEKNESSNW